VRFAYFVVTSSSPLLRFLSLISGNSRNGRNEAHQAQKSGRTPRLRSLDFSASSAIFVAQSSFPAAPDF
jgi:hypothetical protein